MATQTKTTHDLEGFKKKLKDHGLKSTTQRLAVHEAMMCLGHASADSVGDWISSNRKEVRISVASVYNTLTQLALMGIYHHRLSADNKMYFDVNTFKHFHLYDMENNEYKDVIDDELYEMIESRIKHKRFRGYRVDGIDVQILCHPSRRSVK